MVDGSVAERLKAARSAAGMSTRAVAARLKSMSHTTLTNYERGITRPTIEIICKLAQIYERPVNWFIEHGPLLTGVRYRHLRSKTRIRDKNRFEATAQRWLEAYVSLECALSKQLSRRVRFVDDAPRDADGQAMAEWLRDRLKLHPEQPVNSVIEILDSLGIRTIEVATDLPIDGLSARFGDEHVVVLNSNVPNDRARLTASHELGHALFGDCCDERDEASESRVMEFASHFLLPPKVLRRAFFGRSMVRLVQFKERYGISLAAMVFRAERQSILTSRASRALWIEFSRRGWRKHEPGNVRADRATRFEQLLDGALVRRRLTWQRAAEVTGMRADELRKRLEMAMADLGRSGEPPRRLRLVN